MKIGELSSSLAGKADHASVDEIETDLSSSAMQLSARSYAKIGEDGVDPIERRSPMTYALASGIGAVLNE